MKKGTITEFTKIGRVLKTHGLEGGLVVDVERPYLDLFRSSEFVFLELNGSIVPFYVEFVQSENPLIIFLEEITDPEAAAQIYSSGIYLPGKEAPEAETVQDITDFSWTTGFTVFSVDREEIGQIMRVESYPQQAMAIVSYIGREVMLPLHRELIVDVDKPGRSITVEIPEGLLDLPE